MSLKEFAKQKLSGSTLRRLRRYDRIRWLTKLQILRTFRFDVWANPRLAARYVLADPELESFTYDIENTDELSAFVSELLGESPERIAALIREAVTDPVLGRDRGWSWSVKRRTPLGTRLVWYVIARVIKPAVAVETGIHHGLGSEVLLRALQRNSEEGYPGRLISFDVHEDTGVLVSDALRAGWTRIIESTFTALEPVLRGVEVGLLARDTPPTEECANFELTTVLRHAAPRLAVIDSAAELVPALRNLCSEHGVGYHRFSEVAKDHFLPPICNGYAIFERNTAAEADEEMRRKPTKNGC